MMNITREMFYTGSTSIVAMIVVILSLVYGFKPVSTIYDYAVGTLLSIEKAVWLPVGAVPADYRTPLTRCRQTSRQGAVWCEPVKYPTLFAYDHFYPNRFGQYLNNLMVLALIVWGVYSIARAVVSRIYRNTVPSSFPPV